MVRNKKRNKTNYRSDTGSAYSNRFEYHERGNRSSTHKSPFNNYRRFENSNRRYGSSGSRYNTESRTESRYNPGYRKTFKKKIARPTSPVLGSEEHMHLKIKQTSALIMRQLMSPNENIIPVTASPVSTETRLAKDPPLVSKPPPKKSMKTATRKKKKPVSESAEKIHDKIMYHLSKLNDGKKRNLINSSGSGYDEAIQQIVKQKRIEISRALRNMCSETSHSKESTDLINSIIPDIGIKIEDLPQELLEELQSTFDFEIDTGEVTSAAADSTPSEVLLNSEMNYEEDSIQPQSPVQILPGGEFEKTVDDYTSHSLPSCSAIANPENDQVVQEREKSPVGMPELTEVPQSEIVTRSEIATQPEAIVQPVILAQAETVSPSEITELDVKREEESETPLSSTVATELPVVEPNEFLIKSEPDPDISLVVVPDTDLTRPELIESCIKTESDSPSVTVISTQVAQPEFNVSCIVNDIQPDILPASMSPLEEIRPEPNQNMIVTKNVDHGYCRDFGANMEREDNADVELIENVSDVSEMPSEIIMLEGEDKIVASEECPAAVAVTDESVPEKTVEYCSQSTQTEVEKAPTIGTLLKSIFPEPPRDLQEAVDRMMVTDQFISELVKYRQGLFLNFSKSDQVSKNIEQTDKKKADGEIEKVDSKKRNSCAKKRIKKPINSTKMCATDQKKRKRANEKNTSKRGRFGEVQDTVEETTPAENIATIDITYDSEETANELPEKSASENELSSRLGALCEQNMLEFQEVREKMLVTKVFDDTLLAATESGKIFFCSLEDGHFTHVLEVTRVPISSLLCTRGDEGKAYLHVGSFDTSLRTYNFHSKCHLQSVNLTDSIQCMDENWGYIFLGCMRGTIIRYSIKRGVIEYEDKFTEDNIFVIKATKEGVRRVLLIGSRNAPVVIRAAMTGLHLRTMERMFSPTVYSLIIEKNLVYCGTTNHDIMVFNFYDGTLIKSLKASNSKGISCLKITGKLLFASCHNGKIYVYNIESNKFIDSIEGPGGVILSMEVLENQVVVGTMSFKFASIPIPHEILRQKY